MLFELLSIFLYLHFEVCFLLIFKAINSCLNGEAFLGLNFFADPLNLKIIDFLFLWLVSVVYASTQSPLDSHLGLVPVPVVLLIFSLRFQGFIWDLLFVFIFLLALITLVGHV